MTRIALVLLSLVSGLFGLATPGHAQAKATAKLFTRQDGELVRAVVELDVQPGWHLYHTELGPPDAVGMPLSAKLSGTGVEWSRLVLPEPLRLEQPGIGAGGKDTWILGHEGKFVAHALGRVTGSSAPTDIEFALSGLTCQDDGSCVPFKATLKSSGEGAAKLFENFPVIALPGGAAQAPSAATAPPIKEIPPTGRADAKLYTRVEGKLVRAALEIEIEPEWHLYHDDLGPDDAVGQPTSIRMLGPGITWSSARFPEPLRLDQPGLGAGGRDTWINGHEERIVVHLLGRLEGAEPPLETIGAVLVGLTCQDDGSCKPYSQTVKSRGAGRDSLFAEFPLGESDLPAAGTAASTEDGGGDVDATENANTVSAGGVDYGSWTWTREFQPRGEQADHGLGVWLLLAFLAGMILNVMPCVLPVISIKILSFVQQAGEDRKRIFALGLSFAAGIVVVFLVLAMLAVTLGMSWGQQFQSQTFLVVMIGLVFAFGLSLFGLFELGVPQGVGGLAGGQREGLADAFAKGMLATILATPCSGPFLGSTLTWTLSQHPLTIFGVFLMLGLGMAFPYVVLTANPGFLKIVPKPGPWMETFKQAMGFVLMLTVIYLMVSLKQDKLLFTVAFLLFVAGGCWVWGHFANFEQTTAKRYMVLGIALLVPVLGAKLSFGWFRGLFEHQDGAIEWVDFEPDEFERYLSDGRNVFVDFTADWCPNCKYNEKFVFEDEEIRALIRGKGVVPMKVDITHPGPRTDVMEDLRDKLGASSIPFLAVFPGDDPDRPFTEKDVVTVAKMKVIFEALPSRSLPPELDSKR